MRGEEPMMIGAVSYVPELPPHARRRGKTCLQYHAVAGITSACAEKSIIIRTYINLGWNYLRMRGEEA